MVTPKMSEWQCMRDPQWRHDDNVVMTSIALPTLAMASGSKILEKKSA
jgi:hypothetical protein